jgi:hypothetical protein
MAITKVSTRIMENEFMKRGYLLPEGCKDLIDVLMPKGPKHSSESWQTTTEFMQKYYAEMEDILAALPSNKEEIVIPAQILVVELGQMLSYKPYTLLVFRDLTKMGFSKITDILDFETVSKVLGKYGVTCKLADP